MFYYSFTFILPVKQHKSGFSPFRPEKISIIYRIIVLPYRTIYPENIAQFFYFLSHPMQCSPFQAVTGKIYRLKQHFLPPATA